MAQGSVYLSQLFKFTCFFSLTIFLVFSIDSIFNIVLNLIIYDIYRLFSLIIKKVLKI